MTDVSASMKITGPNTDGEYWLHLDLGAGLQKAGFNLGTPMGAIAIAVLNSFANIKESDTP